MIVVHCPLGDDMEDRGFAVSVQEVFELTYALQHW